MGGLALDPLDAIGDNPRRSVIINDALEVMVTLGSPRNDNL